MNTMLQELSYDVDQKVRKNQIFANTNQFPCPFANIRVGDRKWAYESMRSPHCAPSPRDGLPSIKEIHVNIASPPPPLQKGGGFFGIFGLRGG